MFLMSAESAPDDSNPDRNYSRLLSGLLSMCLMVFPFVLASFSGVGIPFCCGFVRFIIPEGLAGDFLRDGDHE
ncbi:TPA: hypothetical protein I8Y21_001155 [Klebsiella oxytoca]|uniref:Uncharacterized protein n=1 Tax=Klebsiella oxytoca TaxID=571 RepID=A0AAN5L5G4_KLEOX|nr:hypothetical protein [Klebsiella oxytoca]